MPPPGQAVTRRWVNLFIEAPDTILVYFVTADILFRLHCYQNYNICVNIVIRLYLYIVLMYYYEESVPEEFQLA